MLQRRAWYKFTNICTKKKAVVSYVKIGQLSDVQFFGKKKNFSVGVACEGVVLSSPVIFIASSDNLILTKVRDARCECVVLCFFVTSYRKCHIYPPHIRFLGKLLTYPFCFKLATKGCMI